MSRETAREYFEWICKSATIRIAPIVPRISQRKNVDARPRPSQTTGGRNRETQKHESCAFIKQCAHRAVPCAKWTMLGRLGHGRCEHRDRGKKFLFCVLCVCRKGFDGYFHLKSFVQFGSSRGIKINQMPDAGRRLAALLQQKRIDVQLGLIGRNKLARTRGCACGFVVNRRERMVLARQTFVKFPNKAVVAV